MVWGKHKDGPLQRNTPWHQASPSGLTEKWHVQFSLYLQTINILHTHAYLTFISLDPKKPGLGEQQIRKKLGDMLVLPRAPLSMYKQQIHSREMCLSEHQNATVLIHIYMQLCTAFSVPQHLPCPQRGADWSWHTEFRGLIFLSPK